MKKLLLASIISLFFGVAFSQTYTFNGNGLWTLAANWSNNTIPPAVLPAGDTIIIDPGAGDSCVLNTSQAISTGATLIIVPGANFIVRQGVTILGVTQSGDSSYIDPRDGQIYTFRHIGTQVWMTKNFNYISPGGGSWCYDINSANCDVYGRLYDWNTALNIAPPPGWHLPSDAEWQILIDYLGGEAIAGGKMKETGTAHWRSPNTGADNSSGFSGLPGGYFNNEINGFFDFIGFYSFWWSSTQYDSTSAWYRSVNTGNSNIYRNYNYGRKPYGQSVRYIRDVVTGSKATLSTDSVTNIVSTAAKSGGRITNNGGSPVRVTGLVWDTLPGPTIGLSSKTINSAITDTFTNTITGLQPGKTYYIKAYATNSAGTGYGNERSFTTPTDISGDSTFFIDPRDGKVYTIKQIGTQVWMTQNLNYVTVSGSWCYGNSLSSCGVYGRLYDWNTALTVAPPGWHLPSKSEWQTLSNLFGGDETAGGKMKEAGTAHWASPNEGADNSSGFTALPSGYRYDGGVFLDIGLAGYWWSSTEYDTAAAFRPAILHSYPYLLNNQSNKSLGCAIRCVRNTPATVYKPTVLTDSVTNITPRTASAGGTVTNNGGSPITRTGLVWDTLPNPTVALLTQTINSTITNTFTNTITNLLPGKTYYIRAYANNSAGTGYGNERTFTTPTDATNDSTILIDPRDGQAYTTRRIGTQVWMTQNLNYVAASGSYCYNESGSQCNVYGRLYDWNTALTVAPPGWHLPTRAEWQTLINYLGGIDVAGGAMKETGVTHWLAPNEGATNSSGFSGLPGGQRTATISYFGAGSYGLFWSSTQASTTEAWGMRLSLDNPFATIASQLNSAGYSVRCIKD